jgi:hypothetical protein
MRLKYRAGPFGPYAPNLNKVLEMLEGHYIRGYGDSQRPDQEIDLLPGASESARSYLQNHVDSLARLERVAGLIEGFETPYGMELLSSIHWVANYQIPPSRNVIDAMDAIHRWSPRKQRMFRPEHIEKAWKRLASDGWLD